MAPTSTRLVRQARVQLRTPDETALNGPIGTGGQESSISAPDRATAADQKHKNM